MSKDDPLDVAFLKSRSSDLSINALISMALLSFPWNWTHKLKSNSISKVMWRTCLLCTNWRIKFQKDSTRSCSAWLRKSRTTTRFQNYDSLLKVLTWKRIRNHYHRIYTADYAKWSQMLDERTCFSTTTRIVAPRIPSVPIMLPVLLAVVAKVPSTTSAKMSKQDHRYQKVMSLTFHGPQNIMQPGSFLTPFLSEQLNISLWVTLYYTLLISLIIPVIV